MAKTPSQRKPHKPRSLIAQRLADPAFRLRRVASKKAYQRKLKHRLED